MRSSALAILPRISASGSLPSTVKTRRGGRCAGLARWLLSCWLNCGTSSTASRAAKAVEVWTRDQDIDRLCTSLSQELLAYMMEKSVAMSFGAHLMFCAKNLERMGDHATNIAEAVHYMVKGETLLRERPKADFTSMLTAAMGRT